MTNKHLGHASHADDDEEPLLPIDDLLRYSRGELPPDWFHTRMAKLLRRMESLPHPTK